MLKPETFEKIERLREMVNNSQNIVAFVGAGCSTESVPLVPIFKRVFALCTVILAVVVIAGCSDPKEKTIDSDTALDYLDDLRNYVENTGDTDIYLYFLEDMDSDYLDKYMADNYNEIYQEGWDDGYEAGYTRGLEDGCDIGYGDALSDYNIE